MPSPPTPTIPAQDHPPLEGSTARRCENCGSPLLGEHCYACGQPTRGLVRHFSSIVGDFLDSVLDFDSRTLRTLRPLLFRPGHLTLEYLAGHRVRYVSPVRLFFFFCVAAFFALQLAVDFEVDGVELDSEIARATTVEEVDRLRDEAVRGLRQAREQTPDAPGARAGMDAAIVAVEREAERRKEWIAENDAAAARGEQAQPYGANQLRVRVAGAEGEGGQDDGSAGIQFNGRPWDAETNPVRVDWLPERGNVWLNQLVGRAQGNVARIQKEPRLLIEAFMEALPQTLFVLLPLFALLLKVVYLFKRRLYMEHLIVALHSHAFLCASLLLFVGLGELRDLLSTDGLVRSALGWAEVALAVWMPLYLLLMQKRVYAQGWIMTLLKFCVLGTCYLVLISLGATFNLAVSVVAM